MLHYELLYILPGTLSEDEVPKQIETVKEVIAKAGGTEVSITAQGKNRLAYPMKHIRYGYFQLGYFQAKPTDVPVIESKLKLVDGMLRVIIRSFEPKNKQMTSIVFSGMSNSPAAMRDEASEDQVTHHVAEPAPVVRKEVVTPVEAPAPEEKKKKTTKKSTETKTQDVNLDDINKKLDQLLENDIASV